MAICLHFELVKVVDTVAVYRFGNCSEKLDGLFEVDIHKSLFQKKVLEDTPLSEIVKLLNQKQSQSKANYVFSKIMKHYQKYKEYPQKGGYFA
ncbi:hypothetical protein MK805_02400 [Shimazuella sp. AN120528]|uniref:hypothetical protein n=1 Tax=Shimazuella soli TaxID=1892854 RepID=UPI001F107FE9|nr:hypothetical protein [Shimazuella soli]MCH5583819.1 hypothetical protein [Shimazuella soli]